LILSIESSCDDSSIAITEIETKKLIFHKKISQIEHNEYGGVVPELASRLHILALPQILQETKPYFRDLKAIAVTNSPGLSVTLLEGVMMAQALSISLNLPLIAVNHLKGHIYSTFIEREAIFPQITMLVSGGHTQIVEVREFNEMKLLISTLDDSLGESFDKVAKMLGLGYPGGPIVEELAKEGDENRFKFPVPLYNSKKLAFSFSGLKNSVRVEIERLGELSHRDKCDICASFQNSATKHLLHKTKKVLSKEIKKFSIVGGVSANSYIRESFKALLDGFGIELITAELEFCSDNSAMIGRCATEQFKRDDFITLEELEVKSRFEGF
jgi:N6-L-threonylcarbamoyladenine synthase